MAPLRYFNRAQEPRRCSAFILGPRFLRLLHPQAFQSGPRPARLANAAPSRHQRGSATIMCSHESQAKGESHLLPPSVMSL